MPGGIKTKVTCSVVAKVPMEKEHMTHEMKVVVETEFDRGVKREEFIYMSIH